MKSFVRFTSILVALLWVSSVQAGPKITEVMQKRLDAEAKNIQEWVKQPLFVDAVKKQNAEGLSLDEIKKRDADWKANKKTPTTFMKEQLAHPVGEWIRQKNKESRGSYPEAFLCDNQGANIAVSKYTGDYWQGDEAKWIDSFAEGKGKVVFGEPEFDKSSKSMNVQVSVPVMDGGNTIGVLVVGVKVSSLKK